MGLRGRHGQEEQLGHQVYLVETFFSKLDMINEFCLFICNYLTGGLETGGVAAEGYIYLRGRRSCGGGRGVIH